MRCLQKQTKHLTDPMTTMSSYVHNFTFAFTHTYWTHTHTHTHTHGTLAQQMVCAGRTRISEPE